MVDLRREPFRIFFPLGILLGAAGVLPWFLFGRGWVRAWPGSYHALAMTQAFLGALAVGFLGTLLPRRVRGAPLSWVEVAALAGSLAAIPILLYRDALAAAELAFLVTLVTLLQFVVRAFLARAERRPPPASFVLLPVGVALGLGGAALLLAFTRGAPPWTLSLGRQLAQQGLMLALVLAIAPMLGHVFATGEAPADPPPARLRRLRLLHGAAGLGLVASFPVEEFASARAGLLLRGGVCLAELALGAGLLAPATRAGLHRRLFRFALWTIPAGLLAAGVTPLRRVPLLHITFVGGLSLLAFAVSVHVTLLHTGRDALADRSPWPVAVAALLTLAAGAVRVSAERMPGYYFEALTLAALLWLAAALVWALFLVPKLVR